MEQASQTWPCFRITCGFVKADSGPTSKVPDSVLGKAQESTFLTSSQVILTLGLETIAGEPLAEKKQVGPVLIMLASGQWVHKVHYSLHFWRCLKCYVMNSKSKGEPGRLTEVAEPLSNESSHGNFHAPQQTALVATATAPSGIGECAFLPAQVEGRVPAQLPVLLENCLTWGEGKWLLCKESVPHCALFCGVVSY